MNAHTKCPDNFIRAWRKHRGLTQVQLARATGIDRSYLTRIETGDRPSSRVLKAAVAKALNCSEYDLVHRPPADPSAFAAFYHSLSQEDQTQALELLRVFFDHEPQVRRRRAA